MLTNKTNFFPLTELMTRDLAAVTVDIPTERGAQKIIIASAYFPYEEETAPPQEVERLIEFCKRSNLHFIIGCDANAHNIAWGSSDTRIRGEYLLDFLNTNNLEILNKGNHPTYRHEGLDREEVIDLTFCSTYLKPIICNWHVSKEITLSDHRYIYFGLKTETPTLDSVRIPRLTDWNAYRQSLQLRTETFALNINDTIDLDEHAEKLTSAVIQAFQEGCPVRTRKAKRKVPWWNDKLEKMRRDLRRLSNHARDSENRQRYKQALTDYNKEIRRSKRSSWRNFCDEVSDLPAASRIKKILCKDHSNGIGTLKKADGNSTESPKESLELLMSTHFPGSIEVERSCFELYSRVTHKTRRNLQRASAFINPPKVKWAIQSFKPFKSAGTDGIFPALLQKGLDILLPYLVKLFKWSYALEHIPQAWREVRVVFIPKAGKRDTEQPKSFRPISLSSFLLKTMEKLIDHNIREDILSRHPLHSKQFAFQQGKSTVNAIHHVVKRIENALEYKEIALTAFLDIEGAFDNTGFDSIKRVAQKRGIHPEMVNWITHMLESRIVTASLNDAETAVKTTRGCPQGGVLSPLLWCLVVDGLLLSLEQQGFETIGFADDLVIMVRGKDDRTISRRLQTALNITWDWCVKEGLSVNPTKTIVVPFTRRHAPTFEALRLNGIQIELSNEAKYLGVLLDKKLSWNPHLTKMKAKAITTLMACKSLFGQRWGLKPQLIFWLYTTVVRPIIAYSSFVWWPKTQQNTTKTVLSRIQRVATLGITGAMRTTPTISLDAILNLPPLDIYFLKDAANTAFRLLKDHEFKPGDYRGHLRIYTLFSDLMNLHVVSDIMPKRYNFDIPYEVTIPNRNLWKNAGPDFSDRSMIYYTDGSKKDGSVGIGVYGPATRFHRPLGSSPSIFQAEVHAIEICARRCLQRRDVRNFHIYILSDSQAALQALNSHIIESRLVLECQNLLRQLTDRNRVTLMWVPGHQGIEGNEIADKLANRGAETKFIGPQPFCGYGLSNFREQLSKWEETEKKKYLNSLGNNSHSRHFVQYSRQRTREVLRLSKAELSKYTGLMTGHCDFLSHLTRIKVAQDATCRLCLEAEETPRHILCECEAVARLRQDGKFFGQGFPTFQTINKSSARTILRFINNLKLTSN
jgi:ribonuclease HI